MGRDYIIFKVVVITSFAFMHIVDPKLILPCNPSIIAYNAKRYPDLFWVI